MSESEHLRVRAMKCRNLAHFADGVGAARRLISLANGYEIEADEIEARFSQIGSTLAVRS
jgi:hypothetical protein